MRLHRLTIEHWRAVAERSIEFGPEVTLIEGPNEVGKSTIIEALRLLLTLRDDSKRQDVKAIQPVGQDVGSRVELEFSFGEYRAIFAKRFNKNRETTLHLLQPKARQLSGREAHEHLLELLDAEVDLTLWNALLVDQGASVGQVILQESASLAAALDAAAGVSAEAAAEDDTGLFEAAQAEYETYYTLGKGNSKFGQLVTELATVEASVLDAQHSLQQVTQDVADQEALARSVEAQQGRLPSLKRALQQHTDAVTGLTALHGRLQLAEQQLDTLTSQHDALQAKHQERVELEGSITKLQHQHAQAQQDAAPLVGQIQQASQLHAAQALAITTQKQQLALANSQMQQLENDKLQLKRLAEATKLRALLAEVEQQAERVRALAQQQTQLLVDAPGLERLRQAHAAVDVALAKRNTARDVG